MLARQLKVFSCYLLSLVTDVIAYLTLPHQKNHISSIFSHYNDIQIFTTHNYIIIHYPAHNVQEVLCGPHSAYIDVPDDDCLAVAVENVVALWVSVDDDR